MADKPKKPVTKPNPPQVPSVDENDVRTGDDTTKVERDAAHTGEFDKLEREVNKGS